MQHSCVNESEYSLLSLLKEHTSGAQLRLKGFAASPRSWVLKEGKRVPLGKEGGEGHSSSKAAGAETRKPRVEHGMGVHRAGPQAGGRRRTPAVAGRRTLVTMIFTQCLQGARDFLVHHVY